MCSNFNGDRTVNPTATPAVSHHFSLLNSDPSIKLLYKLLVQTV